MRFEAVSALLSLFDIQEKLNSEIEFTTSESRESGLPPDGTENEDSLDPTNLQILLENVIQDSCDYVRPVMQSTARHMRHYATFFCLLQINWTLSDFFYPDYNCDLTQQSFNCSREAAELLQLKLDLWTASSNAYNSLKDFIIGCNKDGCNFSVQTVTRSTWVTGLNLNASEPEEAKAKRYLDCIS